ncbi:hypothetical protein D3C87_1467660 [compost metagenome]
MKVNLQKHGNLKPHVDLNPTCNQGPQVYPERRLLGESSRGPSHSSSLRLYQLADNEFGKRGLDQFSSFAQDRLRCWEQRNLAQRHSSHLQKARVESVKIASGTWSVYDI